MCDEHIQTRHYRSSLEHLKKILAAVEAYRREAGGCASTLWCWPASCLHGYARHRSHWTPSRSTAEFAHRSWGSREGAPNSVNALAQTQDGYLWLERRMASIDSTECASNSMNRSRVPDFHRLFQRYMRLLMADCGSATRTQVPVFYAMAGTRLTVVRMVCQGTTFSVLSRIVKALCGRGTDLGLARLEGGRWVRIEEEWNFHGQRTTALFIDHAGILWVGSGRTVMFLPPGSRKFYPTGERTLKLLSRIAESHDGTIWIADIARSVRPISQPGNPPSDQPEIMVGSGNILFDHDGSLWVTTLGDGLRRAPVPERLKGERIGQFSTAVDIYAKKDGLSADRCASILEDREGNIWVGTANGIDQFRATPLVPIPLPARFQQLDLVPGEEGIYG